MNRQLQSNVRPEHVISAFGVRLFLLKTVFGLGLQEIKSKKCSEYLEITTLSMGLK